MEMHNCSEIVLQISAGVFRYSLKVVYKLLIPNEIIGFSFKLFICLRQDLQHQKRELY